jgi:enediyne biosynthesis protein E4
MAFRMIAAGSETLYRDDSSALGIAAATRPVLGFGIAIQDFDGDGRLDLVQINGHVLDRARLGIPQAMRPTLLQGRGSRMADVSSGGGTWFRQAIVGRGLAVGDLEADGRPDLAACALNGPVALLRNASCSGRVLTV